MGSLGGEVIAKKAMWLYPKAMGFAPSERWGHTSCYSHGLVYVFGGCCGGLHFSDVLVLNLNTMSWSTLITKGNAPGPRDSHSAVLWYNKMVVFGGTNGTRKVNDLHILDLGTNEWTQPVCRGTPPSPRESHTATLISDERMVVFGGSGEGMGNYFNELHVLDLKNMRWMSPEVKGNMPCPRDSHAAVTVGNRVFVYGGDCGDRYHGEVDVLDVDSFTWIRLGVCATSPGARAGHAAVRIGFKMYVIGGVGDKRYHDDAWAFDTSSYSWSKLEICGHPPQGRFSHTAVVTGSDIAIYGGCGADERPLKELLVLHLGGELPSGSYNISLCKRFGNNANGENRNWHPKRKRKMNSSAIFDLGSEPEEHSLSLSQHSSPSLSDHEQTSANQRAPGSSTPPASRVFHLFDHGNYLARRVKANSVSPHNCAVEPQFLHNPFYMDQRSEVHARELGRQGEGRLKPNGLVFQNVMGADVQGKVDGVFDSGYLMTATINGRTFRGVLFTPGPGLLYRGTPPSSPNPPQVSNISGSYARTKLAPSRNLSVGNVAQPSMSNGPATFPGAESSLGSDLRDAVLTLGGP
ncbi:hypothetical protein Droror1_Dr00023145 [Drosera rotundifolia]